MSCSQQKWGLLVLVIGNESYLITYSIVFEVAIWLRNWDLDITLRSMFIIHTLDVRFDRDVYLEIMSDGASTSLSNALTFYFNWLTID